ncbi:MAG: tyrosine-protein phosphatase, partial [Gammaproteobacteria bacterium]|nr:tyrosine-protein phosphatase [Gammaproteobacteria bacterium]
ADRAVDVEQRVAFMQAITEGLTRNHAWGYALMFQALQDYAPGGFLVHCTAGKDRTGVGVALIQLALGVSRESIMEDYLLTNEVIDFEGFLLPRLRANLGDDDIDVESAKVLAGVRREYLQGALDEMQRSCGSLEAYLEQAIGLNSRQRDTLRDQFLE